MKTALRLAGAALAGLLAAPAPAQEKPAGPPPGLPALPAPAPELAILAKDVGSWDATVEVMGPGAPSVSRGTETNKMIAGRWLVTDFQGEMMGQRYEGHGIAGWDHRRMRYTMTWVDSMSVAPSSGESTWDPATRTLTGYMEGPDPSGTFQRMRTVTEYKDDATRVFTMYVAGPDGKEAPSLRITYTRRP